jgi:hypothetical protein
LCLYKKYLQFFSVTELELVLVESLALLEDNISSDLALISTLNVHIDALQSLLERLSRRSVDHLHLDGRGSRAPADEDNLRTSTICSLVILEVANDIAAGNKR